MRLIDADAFLRKHCKERAKGDCKNCDWDGDSHCACEIFGVQLMYAPTIEAKPVKHGEWEITEDDYMGLALMKCSLCHEEWCFEGKEEGIDMQLANYNYCPNCGADMRERKET